MVLPNATLFPKAMLPLRIFEPRYREMLNWCLERQRMFCIALLKPDVQDARSTDDFHSVAGLGLVRACVAHPDGTSDLVLQGLTRVRFTGFLQETPFWIAAIDELQVQQAPAGEAATLIAELLHVCANLRNNGLEVPATLDEQLAKISDPDMLGNIIAHTFLFDAQRRQAVLEKVSVAARLRALIQHIREEMSPGS